MNTTGNCLSGGTMHGAGVPVPLEPRPIRERPKRRGLDWGAPTGPDPDAVARLAASKRKPKRLIEFDVDKAAKEYTDGATLSELRVIIAAEIGASITAETIRKRLIAAGVTMRPKANAAPPKRISAEMVATILADHAAGKTIWQTAEELGIGHATVSRYRRTRDREAS